MESKLLPELKICPFCSGEARFSSTSRIGNQWNCWCDKCGLLLGGNYKTKEDAISAWNTRVDSNDKLREALQEAFEKILEAIETKEMLTAKVFAKAGLNLIKNQH